jgi:hypothetical protein
VGVKRKPTIEMINKPKVRHGEFDAAAVIKKVRAQQKAKEEGEERKSEEKQLFDPPSTGDLETVKEADEEEDRSSIVPLKIIK